MPVDQSKLAIRMLEKRLLKSRGCESARYGKRDCFDANLHINDRCNFCQDHAVLIWLRAFREENNVLHGENKKLHMRMVEEAITGVPVSDNEFAKALKPG